MSTRYNNGSHYENHPQAEELRNAAAHAHDAGQQQGKQNHLTGHEQTRHSLEHSPEAHGDGGVSTVGHGIATFGHHDIAALAHELWQARGCPRGSSDEDWFEAVKILRARA